MGPSRTSGRSSNIFHSVTAGALALLLAHGTAAAPAGDTGGASSTGDTSLKIKVGFQHGAVVGGDEVLGTVELSQPAPQGGAEVTIASNNTNAKIAPLLPQSISVPAGDTKAGFQVITSPVSKVQDAVITATYNGVTGEGKLGLKANGVLAVVMKPVSVNAGGSASGEVKLQYPAPKDVLYYKNIAPYGAPKQYVKQLRTGGAKVLLKSTTGVKVPASVNVPSGAASASFSATASQMTANAPQPNSCHMGPSTLTVTITATWEQPKSATLQVSPQSNTTSRYTSQTIRIDPKTILGVSHDAHALVLNGADKCVQGLVTGNIMFIKHFGALKVMKVMKVPESQLAGLKVSSGGVAVAVSSASLTDFINDGTFQVFSQKLGLASEPRGPWKQGLEPDEPVSGDGEWKYKVSGTGSTYSFTAFKQNGGLSASVTGKGDMTKVGYDFLAVIHGDKLQQATYKVDTDGTLDVDWLVQTTAAGQGIGESRLRLPALHSGLVYSADDIPLLFQVYANLIFKPGFGEKAAAQGHFKITYSGEGGIDGSSALNESMDAKADISSTTSSALAAHGVVAAINAPKFAMSLSTVSFLWALDAGLPGALNAKGADLADSLQPRLGVYVKADLKPPTTDDLFKVRRAAYVMWVSSVAYAGAGSLAMLPCQQYYQTYLAQAGVDKDMLGTVSGSVPPEKGVEVAKKEKTTLIPAIKGCEPKQ